jgi:hypothetical protein
MAHLIERRAFLRQLAAVRKKRWVVYAKAPFAGPEAVLPYLSRYTQRVAISNSRLIAFDKNSVTFRYKDYRRDGADRQRAMTLAADEIPWGVNSDHRFGRMWCRPPTLRRSAMIVAASRKEAPAAIRVNLAAIFVSLELSRSKWLITSLSPRGGREDVESISWRAAMFGWYQFRRLVSMGSGFTESSNVKGSRVMSSIPRRLLRLAAAGGRRLTRSTVRPGSGHCWLTNAASRGFVQCFGFQPRKKKTAPLGA